MKRLGFWVKCWQDFNSLKLFAVVMTREFAYCIHVFLLAKARNANDAFPFFEVEKL
jgi:predicted nucleotidyltransferase